MVGYITFIKNMSSRHEISEVPGILILISFKIKTPYFMCVCIYLYICRMPLKYVDCFFKEVLVEQANQNERIFQ